MEFSMKKLLLFSTVLVMIMVQASFAEFYTWEDEHGVAHITDFPPPAHLKGQNVQRHAVGDPAEKSEQYTPQKGKAPVIELYTKTIAPTAKKPKSFCGQMDWFLLNTTWTKMKQPFRDVRILTSQKTCRLPSSTEYRCMVSRRRFITGRSRPCPDEDGNFLLYGNR